MLANIFPLTVLSERKFIRQTVTVRGNIELPLTVNSQRKRSEFRDVTGCTPDAK